MSLIRDAYRIEILGGLADAGEDVLHVFLSSRQLGRSWKSSLGRTHFPEHQADVLRVVYDRVRDPLVQFLRQRRLSRSEPAV